MMTTTILFDLDGTLLPMDNDRFAYGYFKLLAEKMANYGYEPKKLMNTIIEGINVMVTNDGKQSNYEMFWQVFYKVYGEKANTDKKLFDQFYLNEFQLAKNYCGFNPMANITIKQLKAEGYHLSLATNPIFPKVATYSRIKWAGIDADDFTLITTYENIGYCKPNLAYYKEILNRLNRTPQECLMVGNDVGEDMIVQNLGMKAFLLKDCLINRNNEDINKYPNGGFEELINYIHEINN